ncbi:MAG: cytochrome P460 family protein [Candidatus Thiodiazotropha sp. (ex Gloverina cf. vestifex)]|nr:cytochrome P460 family protein [Candidatus Thiodiazotropha sp. (ex Gloverina cf. vestifex)]
MKQKKMIVAAAASMLMTATAQAAPFGGSADASYAADLWASMTAAGYTGKGATMSAPYTGTHPHGAILDTIDTRLKVGDNEGLLIIKRNYGGEGVSKTAVANDPEKYLKAVTVMYKRKGYDSEIKDWFWVKYALDGTPMKNSKGMSLAGRVGKGMGQGCVACHKAAPGGDMVFNHDRYAK